MITLVQGTTREAFLDLPKLFSGQFSWKYAVYSRKQVLRVRPMEVLELNQKLPFNKFYQQNIAGNESYNLMLLNSQNPEFETEFLEDHGWMHQTVLVADSTFLETDFRHDFLLIPLNNHQLSFPILQKRWPQFLNHEFSEPKLHNQS